MVAAAQSDGRPVAHVFMTARDCARYVRRAVASIAQQDLADVHLTFVDDASQDRTADEARSALEQLMPGRHALVVNAAPRGKARNAWEHLRRSSVAADFVAIVDGDDELVDTGALSAVAGAYAAGADVVWTNYQTDRGGVGRNRALDPSRPPRGQGWVTSHLFTFRPELFDAVPESYLRDDGGDWFTAACDWAIAFPLLDQTRRYAYLDRLSYRYTTTNPRSHHNSGVDTRGLSAEHQRRAAAQVLSKPPLPCTRWTLPSQRSAAGRAVEELVQHEGIDASWLAGGGDPSVDVALLGHLRGVLDRCAGPRVLAFGAGPAAKSLAWMCAARGGSLVAVEHDPVRYRQVASELARHAPAGAARVQLAPLVPQDFYGVDTAFYETSWLDHEDVFDVVVVHQPSAGAGSLARLCALPAVAGNLAASGFQLYLPDCGHAPKGRIVDVWRELAPELTYAELSLSGGTLRVGSPVGVLAPS